MKSMIIYSILFCLGLGSCREDNEIPVDTSPVDTSRVDASFMVHNWNFIVHDWEVLSITLAGTSQPLLPPMAYIFKFNTRKQFWFKEEVNVCGGLFDIPEEGKIDITWHGCTKVCCDSDYAQDMDDLVSRVTDYKTDGDTLILIGSGHIKLKKL